MAGAYATARIDADRLASARHHRHHLYTLAANR